MDKDLQQRLQNIELVVFDVDGVFTEGTLSFLNDLSEIKTFNILDGLGIKLLAKGGLKSAIITGRSSAQVEMRASSLGIDYLQQGREDKITALRELWERTGFNASNTAYIGDDLPDLAAIETAAVGATVPNGHHYVKQFADICLQTPGGKGAVREFCELILNAQGKLDAIFKEYRA